MKTSVQNAKTRIQNAFIANKSRLTLALGGIATGMIANPMITYASDIKTIIGAIADVVVKIFPFVGIFFVLAGIFKLIMAYRNDQPEAQAGAAKDIVVGAVFIVFKVFVWDAIKGTLGM